MRRRRNEKLRVREREIEQVLIPDGVRRHTTKETRSVKKNLYRGAIKKLKVTKLDIVFRFSLSVERARDFFPWVFLFVENNVD